MGALRIPLSGQEIQSQLLFGSPPLLQISALGGICVCMRKWGKTPELGRVTKANY